MDIWDITVHISPSTCISKMSSRPLVFRFRYSCVTLANVQLTVRLSICPRPSCNWTSVGLGGVAQDTRPSVLSPEEPPHHGLMMYFSVMFCWGCISIYTTTDVSSNAPQTISASCLSHLITIHLGGCSHLHLVLLTCDLIAQDEF